MSAPGFVPLGGPPLPPGWAQHVAPTGHVYYHNASTNESTYTRPVPTFANMPQAAPAAKKKKEKPLVKTPIPNTDWIRVKTTEGNIFYNNKSTKQSIWTVPEEIAEAVHALEEEEAQAREREEQERADAEKKLAEEERAKEVERIKNEVQDMMGKRKADAAVEEKSVLKKARVEDVPEESDESDMEDWQREAAEQLAKEAEEERKRQEEERKREEEAEKRAKEEEEKAKQRQVNVPDRVDLSLDEAKALFKTLLREKDINPLHPWDTSLPLFVNDPRYVLLPSVAARRDAFDEYCKDRARELRGKAVKEQKEFANPQEAFDKLLKEEVKSTRTSWTDWRRTWKKDRRFYGWGRDDREREKRFRDYLKELGEKKRAEAQKAEADFFALVKESGIGKPGAVWKDVKRKISSDPRYDAVGSSSLREELFNTFVKTQREPESKTAPTETSEPEDGALDDASEEVNKTSEQKRKEQKERAVKEREAQVKAQREKLEASINRTRMGLDQEEGENLFRTMLTDAIRDPQMSWDEAVAQLQKDPRFVNSPLPKNRQIHVYHSHVAQIRDKHLQNLHALFESHAPSLATPFSALPLSSVLASLPATKLGFDERRLESEFERWQRERTTEARRAFDQMLGENAFVEFWGRLGKIGGEGVEGGVKADEYGDEDEGEGGGGKADMKVLAKSIDLREMQKVLKNDKRWIMFEHVPDHREQWLREYISQLSAPKLSVHLPPS